jgi:SAM-dependent methyltransferase
MSVYQTARRIALDWLPPAVSRIVSERVIVPLTNGKGPVHGARKIRTLPELDIQIKHVAELHAVSHDAVHAELATFEFAPNLSALPADPHSVAYRDFQMSLYRLISGRERYNAEVDESVPVDVDKLTRQPFPYVTESAKLTGDQLVMQGTLLRHMPLKPRSRILEFGPGSGNTTLHMALLGHDVTAVEIVPDLACVVERRTTQNGVPVRTVVSDMLSFTSDEPFDAVVFFECFHHCSDHMRLLRNLRALVKPDGFVVFGGEPITDAMPYPWGVRLDGISVWSIRTHGWLELGFQPAYFLDALKRTGWRAQMFASKDVPHCSVYVARPIAG